MDRSTNVVVANTTVSHV